MRTQGFLGARVSGDADVAVDSVRGTAGPTEIEFLGGGTIPETPSWSQRQVRM